MFTTTTYAPVFTTLISSAPPQPLAAGIPNKDRFAQLSRLQPDTGFTPHAVQDRDMAACCLAGLWLLHGYLDESHKISQEIETPSGSFWHGLMHRREPDFGNSKYWFRRVGRHPIFDTLCARAGTLAEPDSPPAGQFLKTQMNWDPFAFIDLCEEAARSAPALEELCRRVQQSEWELLFDFCYRQAIGAS